MYFKKKFVSPNLLDLKSQCQKLIIISYFLQVSTEIKMSVGEKFFKCFTCDSKFSQPKALIEHISSVHVAENSHNCQKCDAKFSEKLQLQKHVISVHKVIRSFKCSNCSKTFLSKSALGTHRSVHEVQNTQHEESDVHDGKKGINLLDDSTENQVENLNNLFTQEINSFECSKCPAEFDSKQELKAHLSSHDEPSPVHEGNKLADSEYKGKEWKLNDFDNDHSEENVPLECSRCPAEFNSKLELNTHLSSHGVYVHEEKKTYESVYNKKDSFNEIRNKKIDPVLGETSSFKCINCPVEFPPNQELAFINHVSSHEGFYRTSIVEFFENHFF